MGAGLLEVGGDPREQLLGDHQAALEEEVEMAGLRHARPVVAVVGGQMIALDQGDPVEMPGEHARRQHAPDAPAHHDRVAAGDCAFVVPMLR